MNGYASLEDALLNGSGTERSFLCHVHGDSNPSASVNSLTGLWYCYACHASGKVDLENIELDPFSVLRNINQIQRRIEESETTYPESYLNLFDSRGPGKYWLSRYSADVCKMHRLGQTPDGMYATIPLRDNDGTLKGVYKRSLTGEMPKYRYPFQAKLSERLYGYHRADKDLIFITEGATDAIAIDEVHPGYSMALYGSHLSRKQASLLYRYDPKVILVATDQDKAGNDVMRSFREHLPGMSVFRLEWDTYNDLASIPVDERSELLDWAISEYDLPVLSRAG